MLLFGLKISIYLHVRYFVVDFVKFGKLELTALVTGIAIMVIEVSSARILSPYLGNTFFTWTSTIAVILGALSIGYFLGGRLSEDKKNFKYLAGVIFAIALYVAIIPFVSPAVLLQSMQYGYEYGPLFASVMLLTIPNVLLGTVEPLLVKMKATSLKAVGKSAGNLYALSTLGGIFGALLTGYILIPNVGMSQTFMITGMALAILGIVVDGKKRGIVVLALIVALALVPIQYGPALYGSVIYQTDTEYYHLEIANYSGNSSLILDLNLDTVLYKNDSGSPVYYKFQPILYDVLNPNPHKALYLGLGGGAMPRYLYNKTNASIDVVEIDPGVIAAAKQFFNFTPNGRIMIYNQDARFFLDNTTNKYNLIVLDSYGSMSLPYYMVSSQAIGLLKAHLEANGTLFVNVVSPASGPDACPFKTMYTALNSTFPNLYVFVSNTQNTSQLQNIIILASTNQRRYTEQYIYDKLNASIGPYDTENIMEDYYNLNVNTTGYKIPTDNLNGYDNCVAKAIADISP